MLKTAAHAPKTAGSTGAAAGRRTRFGACLTAPALLCDTNSDASQLAHFLLMRNTIQAQGCRSSRGLLHWAALVLWRT